MQDDERRDEGYDFGMRTAVAGFVAAAILIAVMFLTSGQV